MQLVTDSINLAQLKVMSERMYGNLVKAVVDIEKGVMVVDADMHADQVAFLLNESEQEHLWGINLHPEKPIDEWVEFDSMINIRPSQGNRSRGVENAQIRKKVIEIVTKLVQR